MMRISKLDRESFHSLHNKVGLILLCTQHSITYTCVHSNMQLCSQNTQWVLLDCQFVCTWILVIFFCVHKSAYGIILCIQLDFYVTIFEKIIWLRMEYMYTNVKMHLKSRILASVWYCKMQGSQSFRGLRPLDPTHWGTTTYSLESHEYCQFWAWIIMKKSWILIF